MSVSDSRSIILSVGEACWPPSRAVSSSDTVGIVLVMRIRSVWGVAERAQGGRGEEGGSRKDIWALHPWPGLNRSLLVAALAWHVGVIRQGTPRLL